MGAHDNLQYVSENQPGSGGEQLWAEVPPPVPQRHVVSETGRHEDDGQETAVVLFSVEGPGF